MTEKKNVTVKEHYIPQFYLRNFLEDGKTIYQYNISTKNSKQVAIDSICYKKNLYEFLDADNKIIHQNMIENCLCVCEAQISNAIKSIQKKAFNKTYVLLLF